MPFISTIYIFLNHTADTELEDNEKELEHSSLQEKLDMELKELDKKLEQKEVNILVVITFMLHFCSVPCFIL